MAKQFVCRTTTCAIIFSFELLIKLNIENTIALRLVLSQKPFNAFLKNSIQSKIEFLIRDWNELKSNQKEIPLKIWKSI